MSGMPRGHRLMWGTVPVVPTSYIQDVWHSAIEFMPADAVAQIDNIVLSTGVIYTAVRYPAGATANAICKHAWGRYEAAAPGLEYEGRIYWVTDNANVANTVDWSWFNRGIAAGASLDAIPGAGSVIPQVSAGANLLNTRSSAFAYDGADPGNGVINLINIVRAGDLMPGDAWLLGVRLSVRYSL